MRMKCDHVLTFVAWFGLSLFSAVLAAPPDLTAPGVIGSIDRTYTYNLGPTGLRGWIHVGGGERGEGTITVESRQILVTVASAPASTVLAVDDVILGAMAASSGEVPLFTNDARRAFAVAIGDAEKTGAGTLRVKRWRAGATNDVNIVMTVMGEYSSTTPYSCPKSSLILTNAVNKFVGQLLADPDFLNKGQHFARPIHALALLGGVVPSHPDYATVQSRLQTYARAIAAGGPATTGLLVWENAYSGLFLAEYYLSTGDTNVLAGLGNYTVSLANSQSMYGTYGHGPALPRVGGSGRFSTGYGPVNQVGIIAGLAMVMGKKALEAGGQTLDSELALAIQRSNAVLGWFANKGTIPYGEHDPVVDSYESNGKNASCAVLFGLQENHATETEFFSRLSVSGFASREYGHTGQGFSYLWGALGANVGGPLATAEYLKNVRWHLDLTRRTDGSFTYDGQEAFGPGVTADGTYLGTSSYNDLNATAIYILTYALPLQRLYITVKDALPANTLNSTKVAHAIASTTFKQNIASRGVAELTTALSDYDPIVRHNAATELGKRSLSAGELSTLRTMVTNTNANARMGACQALGLLKDATSLPLLVQRLDKTIEPDSWVRSMAANAIRYYPPSTASVHLEALLTAFVVNATDPDVIDWDDPFQYSNGNLGFALFGDDVYGWMVNGGANLGSYTINASTNLLYPALRTGFRQPESKARQGTARFAFDRLSLSQVQALIPEVIDLSKYECQVDRMWGANPRAYGISLMGKYKITEGVEVALSMMDVPEGFTWGAPGYINPALDVMDAYGDAARWTLPQLRTYRDTWDPGDNSYPMQVYPNLLETIDSIDNAITAPVQNIGMAVSHSQTVATTGQPLGILLTGSSPRRQATFINITVPAHGRLTGTAPMLTYTPANGYSGLDRFTFQVADGLTTSETATVTIIVGTAGTGLKGDYYDNADFTDLKLTRTDATIDFDWGTGSPDAALGPDTFSARWSGLLLVPESGNYTFSSLSSEGMRIFVNGTLVMDNFTDQSTRWIDGTPISFIQGQMADILIEYYENTGSAVAKLKWTGPSFAGVNGAVIPQSYLFDGSTITNRPALAFPQNLITDKNTALPVTLNGSGGDLTYTVLTTPTNGALSGTAPNLTYSPNLNFTGTDSFTFLVNNGSTNSSPATITVGVQDGPLTHFTWAPATSGNWSEASQWTPGAPDAAGQPNYALNFNVAGTYTATHNLNSGFHLNRLNVAGTITLAGTNGLSFVANGSAMPQLNQNSANSLTINPPLLLAATTTFGGSHAGPVTVAGLISGSGGLVKTSLGTLQINQFNNTYTGGTVLNAGIVTFPAGNGSLTPHFGTGPITINPSATLGVNRTLLSNAIHLNGCRINGGNGYLSVLSGPITLTGNTTINMWTSGGFEITGNISGSGGLTTIGTTQWTMTGSNTYTGPTVIKAGTIRYQASTAVPPGPLVIDNGGKANLNFSGTRPIASLTLGGTAMPAGSYGSTASAAVNKNDTYFAGTGILDAGALSTNIAPVANPQSVTTPVNTAMDITLTGSDAENNPLTYTIVTQPANGTLTGTPPNVHYTPATNYTGIDSFTFKVNDGTVDSPVATVAIAVTALNTPPVVNAGPDQTAYLVMPTASGWRFAPWTGDADSGISASHMYTARHNFGNNRTEVTVNGVIFTESFNTSGTGWSIAGGKADWDGDDDAAVAGDSEKLGQEFVWNGNPRTVTFSNLSTGQIYEASFYSVAWDDNARINTFSTPGVTSTNINQNHYGNNKGIRISCTYTATAASQALTITPFSGGSFHLYAIVNRVVPPAASVTLAGSASDIDYNPLVTMWSVVSPTNAVVSLADEAVTNTTATFFSEGVYTLRLTADDGSAQVQDTVDITAAFYHAVTYHAGGATGGDVPVDNQSPYIAGTEVTVLGQGTLQRTGYTFAGWNTAAGGTGTAYAPGATFPIHADKDLYAQWTPVASTVTFDAGGGSAPVPSSKPVVYGSPYGPLATTLRGGYSLNGWFTAVSGGTVVTQQTLVVAVSDHTLYAQWTLLVPAIPTGMVASVSTGRVDLSWSVSSTTVTSEIRRATSAGGPYETVGTMSGTSFSDTNLSNGGRYFYVIIARNAAGESEATVPIEVQLPVLLPYVEDFESLALAPLDGQSGWQASGVTVQTNIVNTGEKAAQLESEGSIRLEVTGAETNVWTDFFIRPVLFEESPSSIDTNVTTALYFDPDGHPVVYDGPVPVILDHITITNGQWVRITVHSDYATKTWRLYLDNTPVGSERFAFSHTGISGYTDLRVKGAGNADTYLDDVQIMASSPFGEPTTYLLTVISAHGSPVPAAGEHHYPASMLVEASLPVGLFENGSTQHVFKSWVRTGSSPASGTGTNMSFSITENTTIAWLWGTNYWVELRVTGE